MVDKKQRKVKGDRHRFGLYMPYNWDYFYIQNGPLKVCSNYSIDCK